MIEKALVLKLGYINGNPERGKDINSEVFLVKTLQESRLVNEIVAFDYDDFHNQKFTALGEYLIHLCSLTLPDVIIFMPCGIHYLEPPRQALDIISNRLGMKLVMIRGDSVGEMGKRLTNSWMPFVRNMVFQDTTVRSLGYTMEPKAIQSILSAGQTSYFYDKKIKKDIDVCFVGNLRMPHREEYLKYLAENGIKAYIKGGQGIGDEIISWEEYADIINRSKISLNFCMNGCGISQMKGRVIETMACNTMLIEDEGTETNQFFEEGKEFVMAHSKGDMLNKIKYYLGNDSERERIAAAGHRKLNDFYNVRNAWGYIFDEMGFSVQELRQDEHYEWFRAKMKELM